MTDGEKYIEVRREFLSGAGGSFPLRKVLSMVDALLSAYGDGFSMDKAIVALDDTAIWAHAVRDALKDAGK
jgi:hypothetical protein